MPVRLSHKRRKASGMVVASTSEEVVLSVAEATARLQALSEADALLLKKASIHLSFGGARSSRDLRQEAFKRTLAGSRRCPRNLPIVPFLFGVMRSIASADRKSLGRVPELTLVPKDDSTTGKIFEGRDPRLSPEDLAIKEQELVEIKERILALFEDDLVAQTLTEGMMEGMEGKELRAFVGLSERDFDTKRRLVRRRIDKAFPDGWKP
jgi:DNA-directed RNA polymerase specialized sigma24 family protein